MESKFCVYTVLFGDYEILNEQPVANRSNVDFLCVTDDPTLSSISWKIIHVKPILPMDSARSTRLYKICPHRFLGEYDTSLYIDNSVILKTTPEEIFHDLSKTGVNLVCMYHSFRDTVLDEFYEVLISQHDNPNTILEQLNAYNIICPEVLAETPYWAGFILRNHNEQSVINTMEDWLVQVFRYSRRDQLSFNYAVKKHMSDMLSLHIDNHDSKYHRWPNSKRRRKNESNQMALLSTTSEVILRKKVENELANIEARLSEKNRQLDEILDSRVWKYIQVFRKLRLMLFPQNSLRQRFWYACIDLFARFGS